MHFVRIVMLLCLGLVITIPISQAEETKTIKLENTENVTVFLQQGMYSVFPFMAKVQPQDGVYVSFASRTVASHDDPSGGSMIMRSTDGCHTWQVYSQHEDCLIPENANEIQALKAPDGTLISVYVGNEYFPEEKRAELEAAGLEVSNGPKGQIAAGTAHYAKLSKDGGKTWTKVELPMPNLAGIMAFHGGIMTDQGISLWPAYSAPMKGDLGHSYVYRSADCGQTWTLNEIIGYSLGRIPLNETSLIDLGEGHILAFVRTGDSVDHMYRAESINGGLTWGRWSDSGIKGHPPDLLRLKNGHILLAYGYRHAPFGVRARISQDNGQTWGDELILRDDGLNGDLGYPMSTQLEDGTIFTVYYFRAANGGPTHIAGTLWREP